MTYENALKYSPNFMVCRMDLGIVLAEKMADYDKAIQEYGIWSFTWELLEKCSKEDLNDKENFYIELYDSYNYGYNSNKGIKKS